MSASETVIEGIGDEVVVFFGIALLIILVVIAWSSTSVSDRGVFRAAVLVIERRRQSQSARSRPSRTTTVTNSSEVDDRNEGVQTNLPVVETSDSSSSSGTSSEDLAETVSTTIHETSTSSSVETSDTTVYESNCAASSTSTITNDDSARRRKSRTGSSVQESTHEESCSTSSSSEGQIKVRLKFLNDTQKLVDACLADRLGHFKRRHFGEELENNKIVRLIFNGHLLQSDQETLLHYGLFDNCVVHCHISSNVTPAAQPTMAPEVELDLSRLMLPLFGLILGLIWCCRIQYRQYFNATSTFALLCITGLFVVSVVALCMPARAATPRPTPEETTPQQTN